MIDLHIYALSDYQSSKLFLYALRIGTLAMLRTKRHIPLERQEIAKTRQRVRRQMARTRQQAKAQRPFLWKMWKNVSAFMQLLPWWFLPGTIVIGALTISGLWTLSLSLTLVTHGIITTGTVTSYTRSDFCRHGSGDRYDVLFMTSDDRVIHLEVVTASCSDTYQVDDTVPVLYNPDDPYQAQIADFYTLWWVPGTFTLMGIGCSLALGIILYISIKFPRQRKYSKKR